MYKEDEHLPDLFWLHSAILINLIIAINTMKRVMNLTVLNRE